MTDENIDVPSLLSKHGIEPRKAFGQNFLIDNNVLAKIVRSAVRHRPTGIIEIGPGLGSLTQFLAREGVPVVAIEKDKKLVPLLQDLFANKQNVRIIEGDATKIDFSTLVPGIVKPAVVGNLPYSVTTPLLLALLRARAHLGPATVMVQREFADRLVATADTDDYGSLSVLFAAVADVEKLFDVSPACFRPVPKVTSSVLSMTWLDVPKVHVSLEHLETTTRAAFSQRRKMLRNSLKGRFEASKIQKAEALGIDLSRRAETFDLQELARLAECLFSGE